MNNLTEDIRSDLTKIFSERNEVTEDEFEMVFKTNEGEEIQYYIGTRDGAWKTAKKLVSENEGWEIITIGWA
jgi:hypothetical protein